MFANLNNAISIIGAGLAGSEAALTLARHGASVTLYEMRPATMTPAHQTSLPAELVCSNSFKTDRLPTAHGLLKAELTKLQSPLLRIAQACRIPAGSALAVNRREFSQSVQAALDASERIRCVRREAVAPPDGELCIVAAGPLASDSLVGWIQENLAAKALSFYDAIAPIVDRDSIDESIAFYSSRWDDESTDYLNCPFSEEEYRAFWDALTEADQVEARAFENERFFEACLPIEVVAARNYRALTFGALRPVGLTDPRTGRWPFAVCQLRRENAAGTAYGMVGFQTRLKIGDQKRVFSLIPGLAHADFLRYGSIHRNTYLHSPQLLRDNLSFRKRPDIFLAGQLSGNEGYTESIATGHAAALFALARLRSRAVPPPPATTALGALIRHITASGQQPFAPSNVNFGIIDAIAVWEGKKVKKSQKKELLCNRALQDLDAWIRANSVL